MSNTEGYQLGSVSTLSSLLSTVETTGSLSEGTRLIRHVHHHLPGKFVEVVGRIIAMAVDKIFLVNGNS